jgi:hypothetical protein
MTSYEFIEWALILTSLGTLIYLVLRWILRGWIRTVKDVFDDHNSEL